MAQITLANIAHSYSPAASPSDLALKELNHTWQDGGAYALLGPSAAARPPC